MTNPRDPAASPSPADFARQMRALTDRMMTGWTAAAREPSLPPLPKMPATMSATHLQTLVDDLAARRAQVRGLMTQLEAFDQQLGTLESSVRPLLEWTRTWADMEKSLSDFWRPPSSGSAT